jgi:NAD-dependent deacetylase
MTKKKNIVIFTGAGISAESGIKTFRDSDGLWEGHNIEDVATPSAWQKNPELVLKFYNERRKNILTAEPNTAHKAIAQLENNYNVRVVTQNIDDLHERAGSSDITHLHGEIVKMRSEKNTSLIYPIYEDIKLGQLADDGAQLRPHIVWFHEPVPMIDFAVDIVSMADIFVVIGTSLVVYPAASLLNYLRDNTPIYVVDKKVPKVNRTNVTYIEKPATEGIQDLIALLSN